MASRRCLASEAPSSICFFCILRNIQQKSNESSSGRIDSGVVPVLAWNAVSLKETRRWRTWMRPHVEVIQEEDYVWHAAELPHGEGKARQRNLSLDEEDGSASTRVDFVS